MVAQGGCGWLAREHSWWSATMLALCRDLRTLARLQSRARGHARDQPAARTTPWRRLPRQRAVGAALPRASSWSRAELDRRDGRPVMLLFWSIIRLIRIG